MGSKAVAVLGGDRRMHELVSSLLRQGFEVRAHGLPTAPLPPEACCGSPGSALEGADLLVLPVQPVGEDGRLFTQPGAVAVVLTESLLLRMRPDTTVLAGLASDWLRDACRRAELQLVEYREADEFAIWNSIPSAEGAIQMAMEDSPLTVFGSRSLIVGYGRTGKALALLLRGLCSDVTVAVRRETDYARVWASGCKYVPVSDLAAAAANADLLFNTAPAPVITREVLERLPAHAAVIDLAAAPGGTDFGSAAQLGISARLAPGLPGIVAPATAGRIIAEMAIRYLRREPDSTGGRER
jgi:dipicolinate synthase subunit A